MFGSSDGSVREGTVFDIVGRELDARGWEFLIDPTGLPSTVRDNLLDRFDLHKQIRIKGSQPDLLGFKPDGTQFAVEIKGSKDIREAVGDATVNQGGVHESYVAAPADTLDTHQGELERTGVGQIAVADGSVQEVKTPPVSTSNLWLEDIAFQLKYQLNDRGSAGIIAGLQLTQPLNFLAPVFPMQSTRRMEKATTLHRIGQSYNLKPSCLNQAIRGASVLDLIDIVDDEIVRSDNFDLVTDALEGNDIHSLEKLYELKQSTSNSRVLYVENRGVAQLLLKLYKDHPEFRTVMKVVSNTHKDAVTIMEISRQLAKQYPNVFLNLFCSPRDQSQARSVLERDKGYELLHEDQDTWCSVIRQNVLQNFTHQLRHMGVVKASTEVYSKSRTEFDPDEYPWILQDISTY